MPELPEVETIRRQLAPQLEGTRLIDIEILDPRWTHPVAPKQVERALRGLVVERISRSGKYLVWCLEGELYLLMHLRMTGTLLLGPDFEPLHTRVRFTFARGAPAGSRRNQKRLIYVDPRRFGTAHLAYGRAERDSYLASRLGVEPLTPEFTAEHLRRQARGRRAPIKAFLLDQRQIAGVGNIYADEALFRAGIHPLRETGRLRSPDWQRLRIAVEQALGAGIEAKGASIDDFRHLDGARGAFQDAFLVHRREGEPCPRCGRTVRKIVVAGRGTYICERCQPRPRRRRGEVRTARAMPPAAPPAAPSGRPPAAGRNRQAAPHPRRPAGR